MDDLNQNIDLTNQQIAEALSYGVPEEDIYNHLRQSADPHHMEIVKRYDMAQGASKFGTPPTASTNVGSGQSVDTGIIDWMSENPKTAIGLGLVGTATAGALSAAAYKGVVEPWAAGRKEAAILKAQAEAAPSEAVKVQKEQNVIKNRMLDLEVQKMRNESALVDNLKPAQELSPLDAAKLEEQNLRNQKLQLAIEQLKAQEARNQANHEAKLAAAQAKATAAQAQKPVGGTITESEVNMLRSDQKAKIENSIAANQKAEATKAAIPQVAAQAAVAPPTVQLTPTPEVVAEGVPPAHPLEGGKQVFTGTGKPAYVGGAAPTGKFRSEYKSIMDVPSTHALVVGGQQLDALRNMLGQETYTKEFSKRDFPATYEGPQGSKEVGKQINRELGRPTREEALAQGILKEKIGEPTKGIAQKVNNKTLVKVGGIAGALVALPNLAQAAQQKDVGKVADILTDFLVPMFAESHQAGMPRKQEEAIIAEKFKEAQKLGSPYRSVPPPKR